MTRSTPSRFSLFREVGTQISRLTAFRFSPLEISFGILATLALILSPQAAFAQHGGGGGHAGGGGHIGGGGGGGHFSGGGGRAAGFGTSGHSNTVSHGSSPIHVFSGPRSSAPAAASARAALNSAALNAAGRGAAVELGSSDVAAGGSPRGLGMFAEPGSGEAAGRMSLGARQAMPLHTTIGFPPSTDPRFMSISSERGREPLSFSGQGSQIWRNSQGAAANRSSARVTETPQPQRAFPTPPHMRQRPILAGPGLFSPPAFIFSSPIYGLYGPGFGCGPSWVYPFQCNGLDPGVYGGFGYLGFGGGYGNYAVGFGDTGYGYGYDYDGGYYAPPSFDIAAPNLDEGESQEPAPGPYLNPPAENSSPDNSGVDNSAPAPETVIYLKDGSSFAVKDYWVADGQLHYITSYGGENAVDLNLFDLQRTTDENAKQGVFITLRPAPESQPPASQAPTAQPPNPPPPTQ